MSGIRRLVVSAVVLSALVAIGVTVGPKVVSHSDTPPVIFGAGTSLTANAVCSRGTFCISGNGVSGIYPGAPSATTTVTIVNPNAFTITITSLTTTVGNTTNRAVASCPTSDVTVTPFSGSFIVTANTTTTHTLPVGLAVSTANICQGAVWPLSYYGTATPNFTCVNRTTNGAYTVQRGQVVCITGRVDGGVTVQPGGALFLSGATVNGGLSSTGATALQSCGSTINGNVTISGTTGYVLLGDDADDGVPSCAGNTINASPTVTLSGNTGGFEFSANHVLGTVTFSNNTVVGPTIEDAVPEIEGNTINGALSCSATTTPGMIDDGYPNTVIGVRLGQCAQATF